MEIPEFIVSSQTIWPILPSGIHKADFSMVKSRFATTEHRLKLFNGLLDAAKILADSGCKFIYLNGSYVSGKLKPSDYDACWDPSGVEIGSDVIFSDSEFANYLQKEIYHGEFYASDTLSFIEGRDMLQFFQFTRENVSKGIVQIDISSDMMLKRRVMS